MSIAGVSRSGATVCKGASYMDKDVSEMVFKGQIVVDVYEDYTHGWTVLELMPSGGVIALTMSDPVSSVMPLQPPCLEVLRGKKLSGVEIRNKRGIMMTTYKPRLVWGKVASKMEARIPATLIRSVSSFLSTTLYAPLLPVLARDLPYPLALIVIRMPGVPSLLQQVFFFNPGSRLSRWRLLERNCFPAPVTKHTVVDDQVSESNNKGNCSIS
eukprot:TRINITY_DN3938_c2_g1_i1.p1 TRINITY_DN3938_c2_g1~~TRINITY_DN3938_c2_g1_i1.p1  ORF type:complete len:213 (+),score=38.93 TRINITY_DN3938_c2_g1_i1:80-718(+)